MFARRFNTEVLRNHVAAAPDGIVAKLFSHWVLPGEESGKYGLRVAVRDGALNLYRGGQSVAEIRTPWGRYITVRLHMKYYTGPHCDLPGVQCSDQEEYKKLAGDELTVRDEAIQVERWIETADSYCIDEKRFVEHLIARNPNVIDVETGLPRDIALEKIYGGRGASRVDLTVLADGAVPRINFWEAKCASNPELRATPDVNIEAGKGARVAFQIAKYFAWFNASGRADEVSRGFRETGIVLTKLAEIFRKGQRHAALKTWACLAEKEHAIVRQPGLVIANYTPGLADGRRDENALKSESFCRRCDHRERLRKRGIEIVEISCPDDPDIILRHLPPDCEL